MKSQIIREIPLIERYSRHNEAEDMRFRTFIKVGIDLSNKDLDSIVAHVTDEVWEQIDCKSCANCCKTLQIEVSNADAKRLAARLKISLAEFAKKYILSDSEGTKYFSTMPCPFLDSNNLCTVYDDRPDSCREYPFLRKGGFRQRTFMMIESTAVCPIVFNVWDSLKDRLKFRRSRK